MVCHWSLSDCKSPYGTLLSILENLNNGTDSISDFQLFKAPFQAFKNRSKHAQLQLVSRSSSCSVTFLVLWQGPSTYLAFCVFWFRFSGPLVRQVPCFFSLSSRSLTFGAGLGDVLVSHKPREFHAFLSPGEILVCANSRIAKFQFFLSKFPVIHLFHLIQFNFIPTKR